MTHKELRIIIATLLLVKGTCVSYLYAKEGTTVNITCPMTIPVHLLTWRGPPGLKTYFSGSQKAEFNQSKLIYLKNDRQRILQIVDFTKENEGLYQCLSFKGGNYKFDVSLFHSPDISISKVNLSDGTLCLTCSAVGGIPNNYTYEWEHRTNTGDFVRHFPPEPTIKLRMDLFTNNGAYICRVSNNIGTTLKNVRQTSEYNLNVLAAPQFVNTEERYFVQNELTDLKLQYVTNPDANYSVLTDNREISIEDFNLNSINVSLIEARIQVSIYDKLVYIKGYEMYIKIHTLEFNNITIVLRNDRGCANHTMQLKSTDPKDNISENKIVLVILVTTSLLLSIAVAFVLKLIHEKLLVYFKKSCEGREDTETQNDTEEDSHYGTSTTHTRQSELQASFANDIYRDVSQLEASARVEPFIRIQKSVSTYQSSSTGQNNQRENNELNYIEVAFDQQPKQKRHQFYCNDRTPYADVDLTIKVDPLPDSDSESNSEED